MGKPNLVLLLRLKKCTFGGYKKLCTIYVNKGFQGVAPKFHILRPIKRYIIDWWKLKLFSPWKKNSARLKFDAFYSTKVWGRLYKLRKTKLLVCTVYFLLEKNMHFLGGSKAMHSRWKWEVWGDVSIFLI